MSEEPGGEACSVLTAMWHSRLLSRSISETLRDGGESCLILAGQQSAMSTPRPLSLVHPPVFLEHPAFPTSRPLPWLDPLPSTFLSHLMAG